MAEIDTRDRLLDAAEEIFAEHGFHGTSLRTVTAHAGVNVAAVHYHFGSKKDLLEAVVARRVAPMNQQRLKLLEQVVAAAGDGPPSLEAVLHAFLSPTFGVREGLGERGEVVMRLVGRLFTEPSEILEDLVIKTFGEVALRFIAALSRAVPELSPAELFWRYHFAVGAMTHVLFLVVPRTHLLPTFGLPEEAPERSLGRLVAFLAAGFRAPASGPGRDSAGGLAT